MNIPIDPEATLNGANGIRQMMAGKSLKSMAMFLGATAAAIVITAGHHLAVEEGRGILSRMRTSNTTRKDMNKMVLCAVLASDDIPADLIKHLGEQRDAFRAAIQVSIDPEVPETTRAALRRIFRELYRGAQIHAE